MRFPLTLDYGVMLQILGRMKLDDIDGQGTAIGDAIGKCLARLRNEDTKTKLIILITDGEDNGSKVSPLQMAKKRRIVVYLFFLSLLARKAKRLHPFAIVKGRLADVRPIRDNVNPQLLKDIADTTKERFYRATDKEQLEQICMRFLIRLKK